VIVIDADLVTARFSAPLPHRLVHGLVKAVRAELMTAGRDGIRARSRSLVADDHDALRA
jgi:hypothetical protein